MPRNIEIKARLRDPAEQRRLARGLADGPPTILRQRDRFFAAPGGRLKLREVEGEGATLVAYRRPDSADVRRSDYRLAAVQEPDALAALLDFALGGGPELRKERELLLRGRTRIHLDRVEGLGDFLELEVVLGPEEDERDGRAEARALMTALGVAPEDLIGGAYVDLLPED